MIDELARRQAKKAVSVARKALLEARVLHQQIVALRAHLEGLQTTLDEWQ